MPKELADRVVDVLKLDIRAPERDVIEATVAAMREKDAESDRERVEALFDAYRGSGLGVVGVEDTARALEMGQVDELIITAVPSEIDAGTIGRNAGDSGESASGARSAEERAADELVVKARQTAAKIRFVQDASLLQPVGGVGALLRFKL
jgi:peptide subunit release factor 1 (eRF1)